LGHVGIILAHFACQRAPTGCQRVANGLPTGCQRAPTGANGLPTGCQQVVFRSKLINMFGIHKTHFFVFFDDYSSFFDFVKENIENTYFSK